MFWGTNLFFPHRTTSRCHSGHRCLPDRSLTCWGYYYWPACKKGTHGSMWSVLRFVWMMMMMMTVRTSGWKPPADCCVLSHLRLAMRLLLRPMPRHFSRCGAKRDAAISRLQLGHSHSLFFHWLYTWPNMSKPGWSTISGCRMREKR